MAEGLKLLAKISDPGRKDVRTGASQDGREIFIRNVHWGATEEELKAQFIEYGTIERVRIPRNVVGKSKGAGYIIFSTGDEAKAASAAIGKELKGRALHVEISDPKIGGAGKRSTATVFSRASASPAPTSQNGDTAMREGSTPLTAGSPEADSTTTTPAGVPSAVRDHHSRTLLLRNVPDTVNDAQIRALMEQHGALRKITLKVDKGEAMVEFADIKDVGKAELAVQGHEIRTGVHLEIARIDEGKGRRPSTEQGGPAGTIKGKGSSMNPPAVRRPGGLGRRGGKGGLGFKRTAPEAEKDKEEDAKEEDVQMNGTDDGHEDEKSKDAPTGGFKAANSKAKSQDDFRAMLKK